MAITWHIHVYVMLICGTGSTSCDMHINAHIQGVSEQSKLTPCI